MTQRPPVSGNNGPYSGSGNRSANGVNQLYAKQNSSLVQSATVSNSYNSNKTEKKKDNTQNRTRFKRDKFGKIKFNPWTTLAAVGVDVVKKHQITQDHFTTKKRSYQVQRRFITIYTALSPQYKEIAKRFNKRENGLRIKQYTYSKVSGGSESGIKKVPFYGDSAKKARRKALDATLWKTYGK